MHDLPATGGAVDTGPAELDPPLRVSAADLIRDREEGKAAEGGR